METYGGGGDLPGSSLGRRIEAGFLTDGVDSEDGGVAVGAPPNRQWDGVGGTVIEGLPLPTLWHQATWLDIPLRRLLGGLPCLTLPVLPKGWPRHGASQ